MFSIRKLRLTMPIAVITIIVNIGIVIAASADNRQLDDGSENSINVRKPPLSAKGFTDRVYDGNKLGMVKVDSENWNKVKNIDGLFGVVYSDVLNADINESASRVRVEEERKALIKKEEESRFKEKDAWINATDLYIRITTSTAANSVGKLNKGNQVKLISEGKDNNGNSWYQIKTLDGKTGWIYAKYVSMTQIVQPGPALSSAATGDSIAEYAKQFKGYGYKYGGSSPSTGFDCSGFVQYVYAHFGIKVARTSYDLAVQGQAITYANLKPGDVLAFTSGSSIGHVGIYIGNQQFIHAQSAETGVVITSIAPGTRYCTRLNSGRRFVN